MGQGSSTNNKQQPEKADSVDQVDSVEASEEDDTSRVGSLKKNKWLRQKSNEEKPKKPKKNDKKKKKKDATEEVSSATCITESDRTSLRLSRIELHLEECQAVPDEDDAISLSSCGEDTQKNLKDIENEEPSSFLTCDDSSGSNLTASPGESLSSGQDSGFARDNTIQSASSEEEHAETRQKNEKDSSNIDAKLITPSVKATEKCNDYIEQLYPFDPNSPTDSPVKVVLENETKQDPIESPVKVVLENETKQVPIESPVNSMLEDQTKKDPIDAPVNSVSEDEIKNNPIDNSVEINVKQEEFSNAISTSTVPTPLLESQTSITETPKAESQADIIKNSDLVTGMVKELVDETLESAVEYLTNEYKRLNTKQECNEVNGEESISQDDKLEEHQKKELDLSEVSATTDLQEKSEEITEIHTTLPEMPLEPSEVKVSGMGPDGKDIPASEPMEKTEVVTTEEGIVKDTEVADPLNAELITEDLSQDSVSSVDIGNAEVTEKSKDFQELSYSLEVKPPCEEEHKTEKAEDKSETEMTEEVVDLPNCDSILPENPSSTEPENSANNSTEHKVSENASPSSHLDKEKNDSMKPEVVVESNRNEEPITECQPMGSKVTEVIKVTEVDAEDSGLVNSAEADLSLENSEKSVTEDSKVLEDASSLNGSADESITSPEKIAINDSQDNCTESSSGSAESPQLSEDSKGTPEQTQSSETPSNSNNANGTVFV